jgi:hypothetical protein
MFDSSFNPKLTNMKTKLQLTSSSNFDSPSHWNSQGSYREGLKSTTSFIKTLFVVAKKVFML